MNHMFCGCKYLLSFHEISKMNTTNVTDVGGVFKNCLSLKSLPDISKWNTNNATNISGIFSGYIKIIT